MENDATTAEAEKSKRERPKRRVIVPISERSALTPREAAGLFGKSETWGYRRIWDGTFKAVKIAGQVYILRSEVNRLLADATLAVSPVEGKP